MTVSEKLHGASACTTSLIHIVPTLSPDKKAVADSTPKARRSLIGLLFKLLLLLLLGLASAVAACQLTALQKEAVCVPVNIAVNDGLSWAREHEGVVRQLMQKLSPLGQEHLEPLEPVEN